MLNPLKSLTSARLYADLNIEKVIVKIFENNHKAFLKQKITIAEKLTHNYNNFFCKCNKVFKVFKSKLTGFHTKFNSLFSVGGGQVLLLPST